jgi:hypothetical protein
MELEGVMPDGEKKRFESKKLFKLLFEVMKIKFMDERTPTLENFSQRDQNFMKDFVRATLPKYPYIPMMRKAFWMAEKSDPAIYEQSLEDFVGPMT